MSQICRSSSGGQRGKRDFEAASCWKKAVGGRNVEADRCDEADDFVSQKYVESSGVSDALSE